MSIGPICGAWKGKYPSKHDAISDDMFWKDRVKSEVQSEKDYDS